MKDEQTWFRCDKSLKDWLEAKAGEDGRTLSDWIRRHFELIKQKDRKRVDNVKSRG